MTDKIWKRMSFKGNKVWVETDKDGGYVLDNGKVLIKYNLTQDYEYLVNPDSLKSDDPENLVHAKHTCSPQGEKGLSKESTAYSHTEKGVVHVFTDGASSGNPGPSGIGVLLRYNGNEKEISRNIGEGTNNIAELEAIRVALSLIKKPELPVRIYSDSSYAIGLLTRNWKPKKNVELITSIKTLMKPFKNLTFVKVEGHSGIEDNERADFLATSAIKKK